MRRVRLAPRSRNCILLGHARNIREPRRGQRRGSALPPTSSAFPTSADSRSWSAPDANLLPDDARGRQVRYGRDLIAETASLIGPEVPDPSRRFAGNNLNCQNCHLEAGGKQFGIPFQGVTADFPTYGARSGQVGTIQDRVQGCMTRSMNGRPLPPDGPEMKAIVAYLEFMSIGRPNGAPISGRGAGRMPELVRPPTLVAAFDLRRGCAPATAPTDKGCAAASSATR